MPKKILVLSGSPKKGIFDRPNAGESGDIKNKTDIKKKAVALGKEIA